MSRQREYGDLLGSHNHHYLKLCHSRKWTSVILFLTVVNNWTKEVPAGILTPQESIALAYFVGSCLLHLEPPLLNPCRAAHSPVMFLQASPQVRQDTVP